MRPVHCGDPLIDAISEGDLNTVKQRVERFAERDIPRVVGKRLPQWLAHAFTISL